MESPKTGFDRGLHLFRSIAILGVMMIHAATLIGLYLRTDGQVVAAGILPAELLLNVIFHDATICFALISGVLFSRVLRPRGMQAFYRSKLLYLFVPYALFTFGLTLVSPNLLLTNYRWFDGGVSAFLNAFLVNLLNGSAVLIYWYIPVVLALFALTPLLAGLAFRSGLIALKLMVLAMPLLFSRTFPDHSWTTIVYFGGCYFAGIWAGANWPLVRDVISRRAGPLVALCVVSSLLLFVVRDPYDLLPSNNADPIELYHVGWTNFRESLFFVQKLAMSALIILLAERAGNRLFEVARLPGNYAFALYLVHLPVSGILLRVFAALDWRIESVLEYLAAFLMLAVATVLLSMGSVRLGKAIFGRYSRLFLGA